MLPCSLLVILSWVDSLPPYQDVYRFPCPHYARELTNASRTYCEYLEFLQLAYPSKYGTITEVHHDTLRRQELWSKLAYLQQPDTSLTTRLALQELQELLGEEAYYRMDLPAHLPLWAFRPCDAPPLPILPKPHWSIPTYPK